MRELVEANGGKYSKNLTRHITHLVSPKGGGRKVEGAIKWNQFLVDPLWLEDCLKRRARVNEKYYRLSLPKEKRGAGAFTGVPDEAASLLPPNYYAETRRISTHKAIIARNKKKSDDVWASVISALPKGRSKTAIKAESSWDSNLIFNVDEPEVIEEAPVARKRESSGIAESETKRTRLETQNAASIHEYEPSKGIFENLTFAFCGYENAQVRHLEEIVRSHNGRSSINMLHSEVTHVIVNSKIPPSEKAKLTRGLSKTVTIATEWLIERSLFKKSLVCDVWGRYLEHRNLPDFTGLDVSISGFTGVELLHIEKLVPILGATFQPTFTAQRHVLVATPKSNKFQFALKWKIPIVKVEWLWECAKTGTSVPLSPEWVLDNVDYKGQILRGTLPQAKSKVSLRPQNGHTKKEQILEPVKKTHTNAFSSETSQLVELLAGKIAASVSQDASDIENSPGKSRRIIGKARVSSTSSHSSIPSEAVKGSSTSISAEGFTGTQISYCDPDTLREREALLQAMGTSSEIQEYQFSQEMLPAEDAHHHRNLRNRR